MLKSAASKKAFVTLAGDQGMPGSGPTSTHYPPSTCSAGPTPGGTAGLHYLPSVLPRAAAARHLDTARQYVTVIPTGSDVSSSDLRRRDSTTHRLAGP